MADYILEFIDQRPVLELSAPGPQGATGAGIVVKGEVATTAQLPALPNPSLLPGDAYIVQGNLWVYAASGAFVNTGFVEGAQGPQGVPGAVGPKGDTGLQGVQGPKGDKGDKGDQGIQGPQGTSILIKGTLVNSTQLPALPSNVADAYIINGDLWVWANGAWANVGAFRGPQGEQGPIGPIGPKGDKGDTGATGATGADSTVPGPQGIQGIQGPQGIQGIQGIQGPAPVISGTSATSTLIGTGAKTVTVEAGLALTVGQVVRLVSRANAANFMVGTVTSYSGVTLVVNVTYVGGSGTFADWNLSISGDRGAAGTTGAAAVISSTSTTSFAIGTGSKVFVTATALTLVVGQTVRAYQTTTPANYMQGPITAISGTSVTVNVTEIGGTGTIAAWTIGLAGQTGAQGPQGIQGIQGIQGVIGKSVSNAMFSAVGNVAVATGTHRFYVPAAGNITVSKASLGTAGSTATTVNINKNGANVVSLTVATGTNVITNNLTVAVAANDYITVDVVTAGTGAKDLVVQVRIEES